MSGNAESASQQLDKINKALAEYERSKGVPAITPHNEAEQYLNMPHTELRKMTPEQCGEAAVVLAQYGFHLQRAFNEEVARMNWAEDVAKRTIAGDVKQYQAPSFEERKMLAIRGNEYASKLDQIRSWAKARSERLSYLSSKVEFLARTMLELQQTRRRQYGQQSNGNNQ